MVSSLKQKRSSAPSKRPKKKQKRQQQLVCKTWCYEAATKLLREVLAERGWSVEDPYEMVGFSPIAPIGRTDAGLAVPRTWRA